MDLIEPVAGRAFTVSILIIEEYTGGTTADVRLSASLRARGTSLYEDQGFLSKDTAFGSVAGSVDVSIFVDLAVVDAATEAFLEDSSG